MSLVRVLPVLLLLDGGLVKTKNFKNPVYIGDPINAVRIFNEKEVDELVLLDIAATPQQRDPHYDMIRDIVSESFMPIGYGGGIRNLDQIHQLYQTGVEKIILNSSAFDYRLIEQAASKYGNQAVTVSIDVRKSFFGGYTVYTHNGTQKHKISPDHFARQLVEAGAGEIIIQSIDREGSMEGFDVELTRLVSDAVDVPVVASGGAGSADHLRQALREGGASAVAAGSLFVFKGKHRAVLISYTGIS
jgi:imidazole glycerol-phosphate synthase subunit HisF